jgi:hypothetical protein
VQHHDKYDRILRVVADWVHRLGSELTEQTVRLVNSRPTEEFWTLISRDLLDKLSDMGLLQRKSVWLPEIFSAVTVTLVIKFHPARLDPARLRSNIEESIRSRSFQAIIAEDLYALLRDEKPTRDFFPDSKPAAPVSETPEGTALEVDDPIPNNLPPLATVLADIDSGCIRLRGYTRRAVQLKLLDPKLTSGEIARRLGRNPKVIAATLSRALSRIAEYYSSAASQQ